MAPQGNLFGGETGKFSLLENLDFTGGLSGGCGHGKRGEKRLEDEILRLKKSNKACAVVLVRLLFISSVTIMMQ